MSRRLVDDLRLYVDKSNSTNLAFGSTTRQPAIPRHQFSFSHAIQLGQRMSANIGLSYVVDRETFGSLDMDNYLLLRVASRYRVNDAWLGHCVWRTPWTKTTLLANRASAEGSRPEDWRHLADWNGTSRKTAIQRNRPALKYIPKMIAYDPILVAFFTLSRLPGKPWIYGTRNFP